MSRKTSVERWSRGCALLCATLLAATALAGIPEAGIVLRGKVFSSSDVQQFEGTLQWTFTPAGSGDSILLTTPLGTFEGDGGPYSYQVIVPMETRVEGFPDDPDALSMRSQMAKRSVASSRFTPRPPLLR